MSTEWRGELVLYQRAAGHRRSTAIIFYLHLESRRSPNELTQTTSPLIVLVEIALIMSYTADDIPLRKTDPVDPPGVKRKVHPLLRRGRPPFTKDEMTALVQLGPLETLPRQLVAKDTRRPVWQPPVFYYGWELNEDKILEYAKENGFERTSRYTCYKCALEEDPDSKDVTPHPTNPKMVYITKFNRYNTILAVFDAFMEELGIEKMGVSYPIRAVVSPNISTRIFAFYSNYTIGEGTSDKNIDVLSWVMDEYGMGGEPKWWLCAMDCDWRDPGSKWPDL
ncbi:hypothetical protein NM688_g5973 [Phlebia brevispora]|uniref:Uncharacterized protein n=1 Tax=Phlebia brevispora TaxID=194682 RepID=A0ACC1SLM9_9APHY|nr:hypothetical protein NM688_g5973 [Phlebia brevispora]